MSLSSNSTWPVSGTPEPAIIIGWSSCLIRWARRYEKTDIVNSYCAAVALPQVISVMPSVFV